MCLQALVFTGDFTYLDVWWKDSTAGHKQSWKFLKCVDDNSLTQATEDIMRETTLLNLMSAKRKN